MPIQTKKKISKINDDNKFLDRNNEFRQKFEIGITNSNKVFFFFLNGYCCDDMTGRGYIFLGKETHLTFAKEPFDKKKNQYRNSIAAENNFYVCLGSQALNDILDVFFKNKCLPCNCLIFIDDEIANNWDYNEGVNYNLHGKKSVALKISDFTFNDDTEDTKTNNFNSERQELKEAKDGLDFAIKFCKLLSGLKKPDSKFDFDLYCSDDVFVNNVKQIDISEQRAGHSIFIFNSEIKLKFDKNFLDSSNCITKFYVLEHSQAIENISDFMKNNQNPCIKIYFVQDRILKCYILNEKYDVFYEISNYVLNHLSNTNQSLFNIKSLNLSVSEAELVHNFENEVSKVDYYIHDVLGERKNKIEECLLKLENNMLELQNLEKPYTINQRYFICKKIEAVMKYLSNPNNNEKLNYACEISTQRLDSLEELKKNEGNLYPNCIMESVLQNCYDLWNGYKLQALYEWLPQILCNSFAPLLPTEQLYETALSGAQYTQNIELSGRLKEKKLKEEKNRRPNQESQVNHEK